MSVSMTRADGVTVFTMASDPQSQWPPLCQIIKSLCYSPVCCSVSQSLRAIQKTSQSVLGTLQIMVGLLNGGLGAILMCSRGGSWWQMDETGFPVWMAALFVLFGIFCILSEKYPSPCLVICNVILHLAGVGFAIAAIVLYSINMGHIGFWWMCNRYDNYWDSYQTPKPTLSADERRKQEDCLEAKDLLILLVRGINGVLIVLAALELCLVISSAVLGIKAVKNRGKEKSKGCEDPEKYQPLLEPVTA